MINKYTKIFLPSFFAANLIITLFSFFLANIICFGKLNISSSQYMQLLGLIILIKILLSLISKNYHEYRGDQLATQILNFIAGQSIFVLGIAIYMFLGKGYLISDLFLILFIKINFLFVLLFRILRYMLIQNYRNNKKHFKVLLLDDVRNYQATDYFSFGSKYKIHKKIDSHNVDDPEHVVELVNNEIKNTNYDFLLVGSPRNYVNQLTSIISIARGHGLGVFLFPGFAKLINRNFIINYSINDLPLIEIAD